ncbi:hypothetical protein SAMN02745134_01976 [Clostridium acidisoli DSM 12555]|uniref:Energy-coupling factor transport system substrate-specific component n=1 Tax=Clostridium acidisoli DSM 12555 TaxID=1121291 RepID=A0A1W1XIE9_9CLOT|nr:hypothetical protein [Clostridium acidisoli]SMC23760.1 hypothetical protein SAMN02745134_01976 [Clostridium acidisoli DSM 12555]
MLKVKGDEDFMSKSSLLAKGGIYTALSVLCIYLSSIIPTTKLYVLGVASCIIPISILTTNIRNSLIVYAAASILSILLLGIRWNVFAYIIFFGSYGFIKYYIERINKLPLEILLKLIFFNLCMFIIYYIYKLLFMDVLKIKLPLAFAVIAIEFIFLICDYALTLFIAYANRRFIKRLR